MSKTVHASAIISPSAVIAEDVEIGPYAVIEGDVTISDQCRIAAHSIIRAYTTLEAGVQVDSFAVVGGLPQDLSFDPSTVSRVSVGKGTVIREGVTIHRSTQPEGVTQIGENCLLMANAHIAHDCVLADGVILANNVMLAGHVHIGSGSFFGGGAGIHQYVTIGSLVMVAGNASVTYDVPSYVMIAERSLVTGLNLVGLKRKLSREAISDLRRCYKAVYLNPGNPAKLAESVRAETEEGQQFLDFFNSSRRGRFSRSRAQG